MPNHLYQKIVYKLVSQFVVFPIYKMIFKGQLIGKENIPKKVLS